MNPVIRIVCFLVLVVALSRAGAAVVMLSALALLMLYWLNGVHRLSGAVRMLYRVRWLLLSIFVIYLWFTPGQPLAGAYPDVPAWVPTREGLQEGLLRMLSLALVVVAVNLLLELTPRHDLVGSVCWLCRPLRPLGVPCERFALRLVLVMEAVPEVQTLVRDRISATTFPGNRLQRLSGAGAAVFETVLERAEAEPTGRVALPETSRPPLWQWVYPCALVAVVLGAHLAAHAAG